MLQPKQDNRGNYLAVKDVDGTLDFGFDWKRDGYLSTGETISDSVWTADNGAVVSREAITGDNSVTSCFLSGGTVGQQVKLKNTITTTPAARVDSRSWLITIVNR